jgi:replication factor C subunit 3/5
MTCLIGRKGFKLVILDEADMMTQAAQGALRRGKLPVAVHAPDKAKEQVIETHTKNVRFCILCNYVNKITPAIQSRCTRFRFSPLPEKEIEKKVNQVVEKEG